MAGIESRVAIIAGGATGVGAATEDSFGKQPVLQDFLSLIMRDWNVIADTLRSGDVFLPLLLEDDNGATHANDWAIGFRRGMEFHKEQWAARLANEEHGGLLVPIFALAHEHDPDPEMRPYKDAIGAEKREKLIVGAAAGVTGIYRYFKEQRLLEKEPFDSVSTFRRRVPKIGWRAAICLQVALLETQVKFAISQDAETSINKVQLPIPIHAVAPSHQRRAV